jgi:hypothetical protein
MTVAKLLVGPEDFPFLDCLWGCDAEAMGCRMDADFIARWPFLDNVD